MPQILSADVHSSSNHAPGASLTQWPLWDHADLLSCDHIPEGILQDEASWQSFLHSDSTYCLTDWDINDTSPVGEDTAMRDAAVATSQPSTAPSPPNETSREDQTPFAWDPASRRISHIGEVIFDPDDPLLLNVEPRFALTQERYLHLKAVLRQDIVTNDRKTVGGMPSIPSIEVLNVFLSQFVRYFLPQAPVLHYPTFEINTTCPDHLLMIMIAIGAVYCKRRNVRRFAIVLQDLARCHLLMAVTANDVLLKDPNTVYSSALIRYAGIWCGNKRAFELAEALSVVAWTRRLPNHTPATEGNRTGDQDVWLNWIRIESLKRLKWTVFMFDFQISLLTNTPPNMSLSEVFDWECPCDDEYWTAPTARQCKLLLGSAVVPPSKSFAAALGPFILNTPNLRPLKQLNDFGAFLVLLSVNMRVFHYKEEQNMLMKLAHLAFDGGEHEHSLENLPTPDPEDWKPLARSLELWKLTYVGTVQDDSRGGSFFQAAGQVMMNFSRLQMQTSISDLQEIIGKSGRPGFVEARSRFTIWFATHAENTRNLVSVSIKAIEESRRALLDNNHRAISVGELYPGTPSTLSPYGPIYIFLSYVFLCACATAMTLDQKEQLYNPLSAQLAGEVHNPNDHSILANLCGSDNDTAGKEILRHAAQTLALFESWGCSTNLALLLHWRSRIN
ncbi:hypothetical protein KCU62_g8586, partial [Aureobasidium sp. EXF-3399]